MSLKVWNMSIGDAFTAELKDLSPKEKSFWLPITKRYEDYVCKNDSTLTFSEYYNAYEK